MKKILPILFLLLVLPPPVFAVSVEINNVPLAVDQSHDFEVDVKLACKGCTTDSYLRGVFYPSGSSYFGYTQDNFGLWSNAASGGCTTYYKITKADLNTEGSWSGKLKFKPDRESSNYNGTGEYSFKIGRYTPSCSGSPTWSEEKIIAITGPTSTPMPTQAPDPTSTPKPSATLSPAKSPTPIKSGPTARPTQKNAVPTVKQKALQKSVLGASISSDKKSISNTPTPKGHKDASSTNILSSILILTGGALILGCAILIFLKQRKLS